MRNTVKRAYTGTHNKGGNPNANAVTVDKSRKNARISFRLQIVTAENTVSNIFLSTLI